MQLYICLATGDGNVTYPNPPDSLVGADASQEAEAVLGLVGEILTGLNAQLPVHPKTCSWEEVPWQPPALWPWLQLALQLCWPQGGPEDCWAVPWG